MGEEVLADNIGVELAAFQLAKYRFTLRAETHIALPAYKGSAVHGGFGHALKHVSPSFFEYFYNPPGRGAPPKPFVITPPLDGQTQYQPGELFYTELVLVGTATQHLPICFAALDALGQKLGLGSNKGRFKIIQVDYLNSDETFQPLYKDEQWQFASNIINGEQASSQISKGPAQINIQLLTRLRLKDKGRLLKQPPTFTQLLDRILGRLCSLANFYQQHPLLNREARNKLLEASQGIQLKHHTTQWDEWSRFSGRQKEWMTFGGLLGELVYEGELGPFMPYLKMGEWVHVGGKTSFGLGKFCVNEQC